MSEITVDQIMEAKTSMFNSLKNYFKEETDGLALTAKVWGAVWVESWKQSPVWQAFNLAVLGGAVYFAVQGNWIFASALMGTRLLSGLIRVAVQPEKIKAQNEAASTAAMNHMMKGGGIDIEELEKDMNLSKETLSKKETLTTAKASTASKPGRPAGSKNKFIAKLNRRK